MKEKTVKFLQRNKPILIIVLFLMVAIVWGLAALGGSRSALDGVPNTCAVTIWEESLDTNTLQLYPSLVEDYLTYKAFLSSIGVDNEDQKIAWQISSISKNEVALSAALSVKGNWSKTKLDSLPTTISTYKGVKVYAFEYINSHPIAMAWYKGLLLIGRLPVQVEASIARLKGGDRDLPGVLERGGVLCDLENILLSQGLALEGKSKEMLDYLAQRTNQIYLQHQGTTDSLLFEGTLLDMDTSFDAMASTSFLQLLPTNILWSYHLPYEKESWSLGMREHLAKSHVVFGISGLDEPVALLELADIELAEKWLDETAKKRGELQPFTYQLFQLRQLLDDNMFNPLGDDFKNPFWVVLDNYLLISENRLALEQTLSSYIANQTLSQNLDFLQNWQSLSNGEEPGIWYYDRWDSNGKEHYFLLQVSREGLVKGQWKRTKAEDRSKEANLLWAAPLLSEAMSAAQLVEWGGQYAYLIQDKRNHLYLIDENGDERWRKSLKGPIIGEIAVINYYRNEAPCFAFTLSEGIYLINYGGQEIHPFPVAFPSSVVSPLLAADLEGEGYYAFLAATKDGSIYGLTREGTPLPDWSPHEPLDSTINHPLMHLQADDKDYILALSDAGTLFAFARNGSLRFEPIHTQQKISSPIFYQPVLPNGRIAIGDDRGLIHIINLLGDYFRLKASRTLKPSSRFLFTNMHGDERNDYFVYRQDNYSLSFYEGNNFVPFFDKKINYPIDTAFILRHNPYHWVGTLSKAQQNINLIRADGSTHPAFPLAGTTPFCWHNDELGGMRIIVGNGQRLYAYRIYN
jgi:hypothetical protein